MRQSLRFIVLLGMLLPAPLSAQTIQTIAGKGVMAYNGDGGPATRASFYHPMNLLWDEPNKALYISDFFNRRVRKIDSNGIIRSYDSAIVYPAGLAMDGNGDLYVAASGERCVYKLPKAGGKVLVAGNGNSGFSGDGGPATAAALTPIGLAFDAAGNLYISDGNNNRIRKVNTSGIISTVAGSATSGYNGDGIAATSAALKLPGDILFDKAGNLLIVDRGNYRIRKVNTAGIISTLAGKGTFGYSGDGGRADSALISGVRGIALDSGGRIYFSDAGNECIRAIDTSGIIQTIAGTDSIGFYGDGGHPSAALFSEPAGLAMCKDQSLLIADAYNERVRKICTPHEVPTTCYIHMDHANPGAPYDKITFSAVFTPRAAGLHYKWRVNGALVGVDSTFSHAGLALGTMVTVEVIAYNLCSPLFYDTVYVNNSTGISMGGQTFSVAVFPNPTVRFLTIRAGNIAADCNIVDIQGRLLLHSALLPDSQDLIDLSGLSAGIYYLHIRDTRGGRRVIPITRL